MFGGDCNPSRQLKDIELTDNTCRDIREEDELCAVPRWRGLGVD